MVPPVDTPNPPPPDAATRLGPPTPPMGPRRVGPPPPPPDPRDRVADRGARPSAVGDPPPGPPGCAPAGGPGGPGGPSGPSGPGGPPPPPSRAVRGDGPARLTAATIVSATGALLLLAAAATFLAVSWDTLGLTARVAAVGAGTAGAIVGGARLRRTLPAVGAVVFHLGALLLPVDALGLALQLDASRAATWIAVGATALVTLPIAAAVGRSRVLAAAGLAGVPVLATGLGLAGLAPAPALTAVASLVALTVVRRGGEATDAPGVLLGLASPTLAVVAVTGPLSVAAGSALAVAGGRTPVGTAASAGWLPSTWVEPAIAGLVAVVAVVGAAVLRRSARWAGAVPVLVALVAVTTLLPGDAPRLARLLPWPLLFLAAEGTAIAARRDRVLGNVLGRVADTSELVAAVALPAALWTVASATRSGAEVLGFGAPSALTGDPVLAAVATVTAAAWVVAVVRRSEVTGTAIASAAAVVATAGAAVTWLVPAHGLGVVVVLAGVAATLVVSGGGARAATASGAAVVLAGPALLGTWSVATLPGRPSNLGGEALLAAVAAGVALVLAARIARHAEAGEGPLAAGLLLPGVLGAVVVVGTTVAAGSGTRGWVLAVVALMCACAWSLDRVPVAADALRGAAVATALLAGPAGVAGLDAATAVAPAALVLAGILVVEARRVDRPWLLIAAGTVLVRGVAGLAAALTATEPVTGAVLLTLSAAAALTAVARADLRPAGVVAAVTAGVPAIVLLSVTPTALAWGTVAVGATVVGAGLATRQVPVAHVGGGVVTLGVWQLLALAEVSTLDAWLLAPALQVWLLALPARRAGRVSSWVADVPPLVLVVVPALLERVAGGSGWHAALAGGLAVVAVAGGGAGRHGGPLVVGVVGVVAVVVIETLAVVAAVPTWVWLSVGGAILLGAGALIERTGGAPVASARRLVDVVAERFD